MKTPGQKVRMMVGAIAASSFSIGVIHSARADSTQASFFDRRARRAYARGAYEQALREFLDVQVAAPSSRLLFNIAACAEAAGETQLAYTFFSEYMESEDRDPDRRSSAAAKLDELGSDLALVKVTTNPPGATIMVDRPELGAFGKTPRVLALEPGEHAIELRREGFQPASINVTAPRGHTEEVLVDLEPLLGQLRVSSSPRGAKLSLQREGSSRWEDLHHAEATLPVGGYRLRLQAPGHATVVANVIIRQGQTAELALLAPALPEVVGTLLVGTGNAPALIIVDGRKKALAPARIDGVEVGAHHVELRAKGYLTWQGTVVVRDQRTTFLNVSLRPSRPR